MLRDLLNRYLLAISLLAGCFLSTSVVVADNDAVLVQLSNNTITILEKIGFRREQILQKSSKQGGLDFILLRSRSGKRVYDISIFSAGEAYLAISYDDGKRFGKISRFSQLDTLTTLIERIENREQEKDNVKATQSAAANDDQQAATANDQRAGLEEALLKEEKNAAKGDKQDAKERRNDPNRQLAGASADLAAASGGGSGGDAADSPLAKGTAFDGKASNFGNKYSGSGNPCKTQGDAPGTAGSFSAPSGGLASAANDLGGAAVASGMAILLHSMGLRDNSKTGIAMNSEFFSTYGANAELNDLLQQKVEFLEGNIEQKTTLLKGILANVIEEKDNAVTRQYHTVQTLYSRLKAWSRSEGITEPTLVAELQSLIKNLTMDRQLFNTTNDLLAAEQRFGFSVDLSKQLVMLDPDVATPEVAGKAFFTGALLYLKAKALKIPELNQQLQQLNKELLELRDGPFAANKLEIDQKTAEQQKLGEQVETQAQLVRTILENNPFIR